MIKIASLSVAGALLACGLSAVPAHALATRTFVSGHGADSGACALAAPCRTFAFALAQTAARGEIDVVDSAGYGAVTINKSISIVNDGAGVAGIQTVAGANGVTINAGAGDSVHLRGLTIEGLGTGLNGILFSTGGNLEIENCVVRNFANAGINISPSTSSSFSLSNTIASDNFIGIDVAPSGSVVVKGVLGKVTTNTNNYGILVDGTHKTLGLLTVTIDDSVSFANNFGIQSISPPMFLGTTAVYLAHATVTGNSTGVFNNSSIIFTYGNNDINGNATDVSGTLNPVATR